MQAVIRHSLPCANTMPPTMADTRAGRNEQWMEPYPMTHKNTTKDRKFSALSAALALSLGLMLAPTHAAENTEAPQTMTTQAASDTLSAKLQTIPLIAAFMAAMPDVEAQLRQLIQVLAEHGDKQAAKRADVALKQALAAAKGR